MVEKVLPTLSISRIGLIIRSLEPDCIFQRKIKFCLFTLFYWSISSLPLRYTDSVA